MARSWRRHSAFLLPLGPRNPTLTCSSGSCITPWPLFPWRIEGSSPPFPASPEVSSSENVVAGWWPRYLSGRGWGRPSAPWRRRWLRLAGGRWCGRRRRSRPWGWRCSAGGWGASRRRCTRSAGDEGTMHGGGVTVWGVSCSRRLFLGGGGLGHVSLQTFGWWFWSRLVLGWA